MKIIEKLFHKQNKNQHKNEKKKFNCEKVFKVRYSRLVHATETGIINIPAKTKDLAVEKAFKSLKNNNIDQYEMDNISVETDHDGPVAVDKTWIEV